MVSVSQALYAPIERWLENRLDLLRRFACEQVRILHNLINRHPFRNGMTANRNASGRSRCGQCPASRMTSNRAPGMAFA